MKKSTQYLFSDSIVAIENSFVFNMDSDEMTDEEIIECAKHDKECFAQIVQRYDWKIKNYVKRIIGASDDIAEDIVQEVFIKVYKNIHKFDMEMKFQSWIYRIAHNHAVNKYLYEKRRKMENIVDDESGNLKPIEEKVYDIWQELERESNKQQLEKAMQNVSEKYKKVISMNYIEEKSYKEIAEELGCPINTIGTMLSRGKNALKKELIAQRLLRV